MYPTTGSAKHPMASAPRRHRAPFPALAKAKTTSGTTSTAPISRTVAATPSASAPAATSRALGTCRHSSSTSPAAIRVSNSTSGMIVDSSWSWYASSSTGAVASAAAHRGAL